MLPLAVTARIKGTPTGLNTYSECTKFANAFTDSTKKRDTDGSKKHSERTNFTDRAPSHSCRDPVVSVATLTLVLPAFPVPSQKP